jgi:hypothetical protein
MLTTLVTSSMRTTWLGVSVAPWRNMSPHPCLLLREAPVTLLRGWW